MAVTDLTNTMWIINETPSFSPFSGIEAMFSINFTSNNQTFSIFYSAYGKGQVGITYRSGSSSVDVYASGTVWASTAYRTILITGGEQATNTDLINWLYENATLVSRS